MIDTATVDRLRHLTQMIEQAKEERNMLWRGLQESAGDVIVTMSCNPATCEAHARHATRNDALTIGTRRHGYVRYGDYSFDLHKGSPHRSLDIFQFDPPGVIRIRENTITVHDGVYELMASQPFGHGIEHIFVRVSGPMQWSEVSHRRAVNNLRARAARQGIRVRVRDRDITLIDPMNTEILTGGVLEVSAWLLGVHIKAAAAAA